MHADGQVIEVKNQSYFSSLIILYFFNLAAVFTGSLYRCKSSQQWHFLRSLLRWHNSEITLQWDSPKNWCIPAPTQRWEFGESCWITCLQAGLSRREDFTLEAKAAIPRGLREETPFWLAKCSFRCSVLMTTDRRIKLCTLKIFLSLSDTEFLQRNSVPASSVINKYAIDGKWGKDLQNH